MSEVNASPLGEGLVYEAELPLSWQPVDHLAPSRIIRIDESNEELLQFIAVLEEHRAESPDEEPGAHVHELERIEYKINLLLDMVAHILAGQLKMPDIIAVRMSATAIQWQDEKPPMVGSRLLMEIYLNPKFPQPLRLTGVVHNAPPSPEGFNTLVSFEHMSEAVRSWLEKLIFRQHRRAIAHARQQRD